MTGSFRPIKAAVCILEHNGVPACITGDLAYLYYNLNNVYTRAEEPDIKYELCVPDSKADYAAGLLCAGGIFEPYPWSEDEEWPGHEHQRDFPRVRTTNWTNPPHEIVIFPASAYGLDFPDGSVVISLADFGTRPNISQYLAQRPLDRFEFTRMIVPPPLPLPRLPPLIKGLAKTYLRTEDSAQSNEGELCLGYIDNLIHSMNLDKAWVKKNLGDPEDIDRGPDQDPVPDSNSELPVDSKPDREGARGEESDEERRPPGKAGAGLPYNPDEPTYVQDKRKWLKYNSIKDEDSAVVAVVSDLVRGKGEWTKWPRITRSIEKKEEAEHVRLIPGYE